MWYSRTDRGGVREGNDQSFVGLRRKWGVLFPGVVLRLLQPDTGFAGVAVGVLVVVLGEVVLQMVFEKVLDLASLFQTGSVSGGTMRACDL